MGTVYQSAPNGKLIIIFSIYANMISLISSINPALNYLIPSILIISWLAIIVYSMGLINLITNNYQLMPGKFLDAYQKFPGHLIIFLDTYRYARTLFIKF